MNSRRAASALRVLPWALLAVGAMPAATIDTVTIGAASVSIGSGSFTVISSSGLTGSLVKFAGSAGPDCNGPASTCVVQFGFNVLNHAGATVQLDFEFDITSFAGDISWEVSDGGNTLYAFGLTQEGTAVPDSGSVAVNNGFVQFRFESSFAGDGFVLNVPSHSIDFSPGAANTTVPEPGTIALTLAGTAALALARRRRYLNAVQRCIPC